MFRDKKYYELNEKNFGVGSILSANDDENWLVVSYGDTDQIRLLNLQTFELETRTTTVEDINFFTSDECRSISNMIPRNYTFTDYIPDPKGLKGYKSEVWK